MGVLSQNIDTEITPDRLKEIGFEFKLAINAIKALQKVNEITGKLADNHIDDAIELSKQYSYYAWRPVDDPFRYQPLTVRYYPETSMVHVCYNNEMVSVAGCIIAYQHSMDDICIYHKVNDMMDISTVLAEIKIYKEKIMQGEV